MARGNRLAVERGVAGTSVSYSHHGIDVGDGTVVHARPHDFRAPFGGGRVERTSLAEFAAGREVRVVAEPPPAFPADVIATRALDHVGRAGYCPVVDNCEHFATWCATGRRSSRQVDLVVGRGAGRVVVRTLAGTTLWLAGSAAAGAAGRLTRD